MHVPTIKYKQEIRCLHESAGLGNTHVLKTLYGGLYHTLCIEVVQSRDN